MPGGRHALDTVPGLAALLTTQAGLARRGQLRRLGVTAGDVDRQVAAGRWRLVAPEVVSADNGRLDAQQLRWRAVLHAPCAWLGGRSALAQRGLAGSPPADEHVVVPRLRRPAALAGVVVHVTRRLPDPAEAGEHDDLPDWLVSELSTSGPATAVQDVRDSAARTPLAIASHPMTASTASTPLVIASDPVATSAARTPLVIACDPVATSAARAAVAIASDPVATSTARTPLVIASPPVATSAARAAVDAAAWERWPRAAAGLVLAVVQQRLASASEILEELEAAGRVRHRAVVRDALAHAVDGAESVAEVDVLPLLRAAGFGLPRRQVRRAGRRRDLEVDLPDGRLLVLEVDGPLHDTPEARWADADRDAELVALGIQVLRVSTYDIRHDPQRVVTRLRTIHDAARRRANGH